ncbi:winged helix-turn-helix transcriptional regulator [Mucilaginibacter angelicae]|uniref:Winged helix-turn-helix transcriptional regulator n=1 Tax=Mucilaginibacter angelicae TaxID=869718 RepID=A0ABV6LB30_9SPHI
MKNHSIADIQRDKMQAASEKFCPVIATIDVLSGKWKMPILWELYHGVKRFGELKEAMPKVTPGVLSTQLQALASEGIIRRELYAEVPPKVEYSLTANGRALVSVICAMEEWGIDYLKNANSAFNPDCLWTNV